MLSRQLTDFGINPILAALSGVVLFVAAAYMLFLKVASAEFLLAGLGVFAVARLSETQRNDFLKTCFAKGQYLQIRLLENLAITAPFLGYLLYEQHWIPAATLLAINTSIALVNFRSTFNMSLPTPFSKTPFEFTVGFRKTYLAFPFAAVLTYLSIVHHNFNLGIAALLLVFLFCMTFYGSPERKYFVWIFSETPQQFLRKKMSTALLHSSMVTLPFAITLCYFNPTYWPVIIGFQVLGSIYLLTIVLAKYSAYPNTMSVPQGVLLAISLTLPIILLGIIPYFWKQSVQHLNKTLA